MRAGLSSSGNPFTQKMNESLANTAFSAFLCAIPTIPAVLTGIALISASAGGGKYIKRDLIDEKNGQHDLSQDGKQLVAHKSVLLCFYSLSSVAVTFAVAPVPTAKVLSHALKPGFSSLIL